MAWEEEVQILELITEFMVLNKDSVSGSPVELVSRKLPALPSRMKILI